VRVITRISRPSGVRPVPPTALVKPVQGS
jgi:hypothetical protein